MADRMGRRLAPALALVLLAGLAGCGDADPAPGAQASRSAPPATSDTPPSPPSAAVDPCVLVTRSEAEALAGTPLEDGQRDQDRCRYTGPVTGPSAQVEVFVDETAKNLYDGDRQLGHTFQTVVGIGDEAHVEDFAIFFSKAGFWVAIRLVRTDDWARYRPRMEATAKAAAARI
jgi:hypothetical protein